MLLVQTQGTLTVQDLLFLYFAIAIYFRLRQVEDDLLLILHHEPRHLTYAGCGQFQEAWNA